MTTSPLTKRTLLWRFMQGSKRFFIISIFTSLAITFVDTAVPQVIRYTVDTVLGDKPSTFPAAVNAWVVSRICVSICGYWPSPSVVLRCSPAFLAICNVYSAPSPPRRWCAVCGICSFRTFSICPFRGICKTARATSFNAVRPMWKR